MIIDIHTHILDKKIYQDYLFKANNRIKKALVMADNRTDLSDLLKFSQTEKGLYIIGAVNINKNIKNQLVLLKNKNIFGLKLYPGYQHFYPSDKKIYPVAEFCKKYNKPLIFHSGDVWDTKGSAILKYSNSIYIDELAVKFPDCKIVIAHLGFPRLLETANVVSKNKNVYADISGTIDNCESSKERKDILNQYIKDLKRIFSYYPDIKEKLLFGTDYSGESTPLNEIDPYINLVKRVFTKKEQESVFYKLANNMFRLEDKK